MFAIVATSGRQYRVEPGATITVDRMDAEVGDTVTLEQVLMVSDKKVKVGSPTVKGANITAKVLAHGRGDKVVAFKYHPRSRYRRRVGFRASHTTLEIVDIKA